MKITKYVHSCLLVEMPEPTNRTALFDPGTMSQSVLDVNSLKFLDDIIITHNHPDHMSLELVQSLVAKFPDVRITTTPQAAGQLNEKGIRAFTEPSDGIVFFDAPHEDIQPLFPQPQQIGVHYLDMLTDPGDSHSFSETKSILALPVQAPWGSTIKALHVALDLKPRYVIPIHDWHWSDEARVSAYDILEKQLAPHNIQLLKPVTAEPFVIDL